MIVLHTLGVAAIHLGARRLLPSATRAFAALLFLGIERERRVSRRELQALLFPEQRDRAAAHNVRQLLYRLRNLGAPVVAGDRFVALPAGEVTDDFSSLRAGAVQLESLRALAGGILPDYAPTFSRSFGQWVEAQRGRIGHGVLGVLAQRLAELRSAGRWRELEPVARAVLAIDPLHEEATLALAESLALAGQKARAVQLLDSYIGDVGAFGSELRLSAQVLRTRISEHVPDATYRRLGPGPFVGRDGEMAELWRHYQRAKRGEPRTVVIHGEPGIGKTRLATEFLRAAALDGATCFKVECAPHDIRRPLGVFVDLVPKLLEAPGGLGVAPEGKAILQQFARPTESPISSDAASNPERLYDAIVGAIADLFDALSEEATLVLLLDDAHSLDASSLRLTYTIGRTSTTSRVVFVLTSRVKLLPPREEGGFACFAWLKTGPLASNASEELSRALVGGPDRESTHATIVDRVSLAGGNPLFLRWLIAEPPSTADTQLPASLVDLLTQRVHQLSGVALRVFVAAVVLGRHCRLDRLSDLASLEIGELLDVIHDLEVEGYLVADGEEIRSAHPMLSHIAKRMLPPVTQRLMHASAAIALETEGQATRDITMMWDAAEHWHGGGATAKSVRLLRTCAAHSVSIGHPRTAAGLLRRAAALAPAELQQQYAQDTVEVARLSEDYSLVLESVETLRRLKNVPKGTTVHDDLELVAIQAERFSGGSLVASIPRLTQCVSAESATPGHRLKAALYLLAAHDLQLDQPAASSLFQHLILARSLTRDTTWELLSIKLLYHCFAGKSHCAVRAARGLLTMASEVDPLALRVRLIAEAGMGLFRCGDHSGALEAMTSAYVTCSTNGMRSSMIDTASSLAWMYRVLGSPTDSAHWGTVADSHYASDARPSGRTSHYLSNKIEFALDDQDLDEARGWLARAETEYSEINAPRSRQLALAFRLRLAQLERTNAEPPVALRDLQVMHEVGRACGLHDNFAEAYWHELTRQGLRAQADEMLTYYLARYRRDRFPPPRSFPQLAKLSANSIGQLRPER